MTDAPKRRCFEAGHRPKMLVVADETEECGRAVYFAAKRAKRTGASVIMLGINSQSDFTNWFNVGNVMREENEAEVRAVLTKAAARARAVTGSEPEQVVRTGKKAEEIQALIAEDEDIQLLILAAGTGSEGPGPLVSTLAGKLAGTFPIPLVVVPGHLRDDEIDALA